MLEQLASSLGLGGLGAIGGPPELSHRQRIELMLDGHPIDRVPVCFWHHFQPAGNGRALAKQTYDFFVTDYDLDIVKIMPDLHYPFPHKSIQSIDDWRLLEPIDPQRSPWVQQQVECINALMERILLEAPIIVTMFSPLTEALYFAQSTEQFLEHAQQAPALVHQALGVIAENLKAAAEQLLRAGADGLFFALQGATTATMPEATYREFGRPYDFTALRGAQNGWFNVLHLHGDKDLMFDMALDYPVQALSWSDRIAGPSLREARTKTSLCLMGGWNEQELFGGGKEAEINSQALDAFSQTLGAKFILAPGCSIPDDSDEIAMGVARDTADLLTNDEFFADEDEFDDQFYSDEDEEDEE
jgi:uroporphyrinogen decarboxylase